MVGDGCLFREKNSRVKGAAEGKFSREGRTQSLRPQGDRDRDTVSNGEEETESELMKEMLRVSSLSCPLGHFLP